MGVLKISSLFVLTCWVLSIRLEAHCDCPGISLKLLQAPHEMSNSNSATFAFESYFVTNGEPCTTCNFTCKLDDGNFSECEDKKVTYGGLSDGKHSFKVCSNGSAGLDCACHNWKIDTVPPTASLTSSTSLTNALNFTVNVSFSETCSGGGGFRCSTVEGCNLHVYGAGQVVPSSLRILRPNLIYSLLVSLNPSSQNGSLILFMDKDFCYDRAGNRFMQTKSSNLTVNYDRTRTRTSVSVNLTTLIDEQIFQIDGQNRTVQATNDHDHLKIYLNFSQPILNSSADILSLLNISTGSLVPISGYTEDNRSFGFAVVNESSAAVVTITTNSNFILTRQGTIVSPTASVTFLYDTERPEVRLHTFPLRTRERIIPVSIEFTKPVYDFNMSNIVISGGHFHRLLSSFQKDGWSIYNIEIEAEHDNISVHFPENVTADVAGNKNTASDSLQVRHYTIPTLSRVVSTAATAAFLATSFAAGLLSVTTASLQSLGASEPSRNLFRMVCHMQVFALSRWLPVVLPVEYYEVARGIQWTIPYFSLPWGAGHIQSNMAGASPPPGSKTFITGTANSETYASIWPSQDKLGNARAVKIPPLNPGGYPFLKGTNNKSKDPYIYDRQNANGWRDFGGNMFWLAVIGGGLMLLHALLLLILKSKKKNNGNQRDYGALSFPRFELFLLILVLPCLCQASANVIRGRTTSGIVVGILLAGLVSFALLTLLIFLSSGITNGKLLQYNKEVQQEDRRNHWYQELVRVTLGPRQGGHWMWKNQTNSNHLIMFGPLFEDLRGPSEYMNSSNSRSNLHGGDRKEDEEPLFIQKLFSILRIYYPLLECIKRVSLGIIAGAYSRNQYSRTPTITLLCITGFQLFSLVLKKPFISKRVQLVEIISVSTEVGLFASCAATPRRESFKKEETSIGFSMVMLFLMGFVAQMVNEWCALYLQTKRLGGLKGASRGLVSIFLSSSMIQDIENMPQTDQPKLREPVDTSSLAGRNKSSSIQSSSTNKQRPGHQRDLVKASFSEEGNKAPTDSSHTIWSGFGGCIRNESLPSSVIQDAESMILTDQPESREPIDTGSSTNRNRSLSSRSSDIDKPRLRHQRDLAKASFSKEESKALTNPLSSIWSGFWGCIRNESLPSSVIQGAESMIPIDQLESREPADTSSSADRNRSSSQRLGIDKPRLRHQGDLAKASFSKEGNKAPTDSLSTIWSGFWGCIRNESLPSSVIQDAESIILTDKPESREPTDTSSSVDRNKSSSSWSSSIVKQKPRHQRDLAKASFSQERNKAPTDPSSSIWSGFWGCIRSESLPSSMIQDTKSMIPTDQLESRELADTSSSADRNRSFSS